MALSISQRETAARVAHLLAESPLDEEIKGVILDGVDKLPDYLIYQLLDALQNEREQLKSVALAIQFFLNNQEEEWAVLQNRQRVLASEIAGRYQQKIVDEIRLKSARETIASQ